MKRLSALSLIAASVSALAFAASPSVGKRTNALDNSIWEHSQWISAADAPVVSGPIGGDNERAADGAAWFVATFTNPKPLVSARWMTTSLGTNRLFVNGCSVGDEVLRPGFTHYAKTKLSFTYDVTDALARGAGQSNVISAQVTPGWWADKIITPGGNDGMIGKKVAFRGVLELTYSDGTKDYIGTDTTRWRAGIAGPVTHAAIFDGEEYDARQLPGHDTPEKLSTPEINAEFSGCIFPSDGAEIYRRPDLALSPVKAYTWSGVTGQTDDAFGRVVVNEEFTPGQEITLLPGQTLVVDFGQNAAAVPAFEFQAAEGTKLVCRPGELLNDGNGAHKRGMDGPEGSVHRQNLRIPDSGMLLSYTFGPGGEMTEYFPQSTFFGYRYISITADAPVTIRSIKSIPVSSIAAEMETGRITTGNTLINRLISNTIWGQRSNYLSVPTDCPQRNERLGWTADTQVFSETGTFFANTDRFFHKWMRDMRDSQNDLGGFPGVAPTAQYGNEMTRLGWADAGIIVPWTVWKQFGDTAIINENWDAMRRFVSHIADTRYSHEALVGENGNYQWADWLSYEPLESCSGAHAYRDENGNYAIRPETFDYWNYLSASYWLIDASMMRDMATATGRDATPYESMAREARQYLRDRFLNPDGTFKTEILNTMQTPALFALKNNLAEGEARDAIIARLRTNFADHGNCLQTGFLGTSILMPTLTENGMTDLAYELLLQRKNPSWLYSVDNGATTIWERWNSYMIENGMGPSGMNSFNHYAYGCVGEWLWETAAGIAADPSAPGFRRIIMKPEPDRRLGFVDAEYDSAAGTIKSHWRYEGDEWLWDFTVPEGAVAEVTLPGETKAREYTAGTYSIVKTLNRN